VKSAGAAFWELAAFNGILPSYPDAQGRLQQTSPDVVAALLRALGVPLEKPEKAAPLLRAQQARALRRRLEPVLVYRIGRRDAVTATVPEGFEVDTVWLSIDLEQGDTWRLRLQEAMARVTGRSEAEGTRYHHLSLDLTDATREPLPPGRHWITLEGAGPPETALLLSAPDCPSAGRQTGAFMPIHALRSAADWGIGSYSELARLSKWASENGCDLVGTLPVYPAFLDPPADPSPYLPVSRLAYNEVFVDPVALPEFVKSQEARERCSSASFREHLASLRSSTLVDYEEVARLKRSVLEELSQVVESGETPQRRRELAEFVRRRPELEAYARFRARLESPAGRETPSAVAYHRYCQWAACEQLVAAGRYTGQYADFPVGSHPHGFDPAWSPDSFVRDVHGGAPPDRFFPGGQDWGFWPLHPERIRDDGYAFLSAALRRAFLHADCLRIDHVMGLQRLFMIPEGSSEGAYVSYRPEELHALVALEAHRADAAVVGEDLGTVPEEVRPRMAREGMLRTWVFQFESTAELPLPPPPAQCLATLGTHDLPRFGAYLWGDDIADRQSQGLLSAADATDEWQNREEWRQKLFDALGLTDIGSDMGKLTAAALEGCLLGLAGSAAAITLVDLGDLWGERGQENIPGSGPGGSNWRRRSARTLDEIETDQWAHTLFQEIATRRQG
jgi:4-alpha-glucanotransferase